MTTRYVVQKAPGVAGEPIPDDEPCLVVRGQDCLAPFMLEVYIARYRDEYGADLLVLDELAEHLDRLKQWQSDNPDVVKLADR